MHPTIEAAKEITKEQTRQITLAMEFIPEGRRNWVPSGCAKTPMEIYMECAGCYMFFARLVQGEAADWGEVLRKAKEDRSLDDAKRLMDEYQEALFKALDSLPESKLNEKMILPWGQETTWGQFAFLASYHTCYHAGQLNYIQTLLGDADMHF